MEASLLGRNVKLTRGDGLPKTLRMLVGDNSEIDDLPMKVLVTGAGGMLGRDVVAAAHARGHEVVGARPRRARHHRRRRGRATRSPSCGPTR